MKALLLAPMGSVHRRFNRANIEALRTLGYEVHLVANFEVGDGTEKQNGEYTEWCAKEGIITHSIAYERHSLKGSLSKTAETRELLKKENFELIHAHTETGGLILRLAGKPYKNSRYIYTPHGMSFYKGSSLKSQMIYRPIERWICSGMDVNIAINREEFSVLKKWNTESAVFVHGIGLDLERFRSVESDYSEKIRDELNIPVDAKVIMSVGELDDNKNHQIVIRALALLKRDNVYYIICGVGPNKEKLEKLAGTLGIADRVVLAGYRKDIPEILHISDIFAFPSFHEGLPVSLMEAMAAGVPVICSKIRGNVDLMKDGCGGFMSDPSDAVSFSRAIDKLVNAQDGGKNMSNWNIARSEDYSYQNVFNELSNIYRG